MGTGKKIGIAILIIVIGFGILYVVMSFPIQYTDNYSGIGVDQENFNVWGWRTKLRVQTSGSVTVFVEGPAGFSESQGGDSDQVYEIGFNVGYYNITVIYGSGSVTVTASAWIII